jgi:hypothetical protein
MRIQQILENSTTAGSVATVAQPMMTQTRESVAVPGLKPVQQVMKGKSKKKGPYANSINEGKVKELAQDLKDLTSHQFQEKYKQSKADVRADMKKVNEDDLSEQDLIVIPGQGRLRKTGFVKHDLDQGEHEGHTLKNSLHTIIRVATDLDKRLSVQSEFPEWVSEKIGATKSMMVTVMDYLISSQEMQHDRNDMNEGSQRVDSIVTDALKVMKGPEISDAVLALKRVLGDRAYNERRGFYSFYVDQIHRNWQLPMYGQQDLSEGDVSTGNLQTMYNLARMAKNYCSDPEGKEALTELLRILKWYMDQGSEQGVEEGDMFGDAEVSWEKGGRRAPTGAFRNPNFGNVLQKSVNKHNKAIVKTKQAVGSRVADIGAGGKEHNEKTDAAWDAAKKKVAESYKKK